MPVTVRASEGAKPQLAPDTRLQLCPGIRTRLDAAGHVLVDAPDGSMIDIGPRGYATLALFAQPRALGEAIDRLEADESGATDLLPTLSVVNTLLEEGVLVDADTGQRSAGGWADPVDHARMLHDTRRTGAYLAAIDAAVRPGDVVLDLGTGSGVLAVSAARAGARHVYAIEATDIADVAERVFAANGVADRITLIRGWSKQIELPERADVLVAELIGNDPFEEELLETTIDARERLLQPGARLVPDGLTVLARPLLLPEADVGLHAVGHAAIESWKQAYGIDFEPLLDAAPSARTYSSTDGPITASWQPVGAPVVLAEVDLAAAGDASIDTRADLVVEGAWLNAVAMTFSAALYGDITHTLDPWRWPASSWSTPVWVFGDPVRVPTGTVLSVRYTRRVTGEPDGLRCEVVARTNRDGN